MTESRRAAYLTLLFLATVLPAHALTVLNRGNGSEPKSLDPAFVDTAAESNILGDILVGLTTLDASGRPIPGMAERWDISKDGKTWVFHLRKAQWSDGHPVAAGDFVFAWQRLLDPRTAAPYAYNLWVLKNAKAISNGTMPPSALGVRATNDRTLVVQLEHPAPYLPELLTHDTAYPVPRHVLLAKGNTWAKIGNYVGNGPYLPAQWVLNEHLTLTKNQNFYDAAHVRIDKVNYVPLEDSASALKRIRAGELDMQSPIPASNIDWLRANMGSALRMTPYLSLSYITMNTARAPLNDVRVRKALNLAFDRETVTSKVLKLGDLPAYAMVPPGVANFPGGAAMDIRSIPQPARGEQARALMRQAGYGPGNLLHLTLETTHDPDNKRVAAVLQAMLHAIYVDLSIQSADLQIHYRNMQTGNYEIATAVWIADFNDATNFLDLLQSASGNNYARYRNSDFDRALAAAQEEIDPGKRGQLLLGAEKIALNDYPWIPWRFRVTQNLVQPWVRGFIPNVRDYNRSRWLWISGRPAR